MTALRSDQILTLVLLVLLLLVRVEQTTSAQGASSFYLPSELFLIKSSAIPIPVDTERVPMELPVSASAAAAIDISSGSYLYLKNENQPLYPASTTKLMTALVAVSLYNLDETVRVSSDAARTPGTILNFVPGQSILVRDLVKAALIQSGNDAAEMLAELHPEGKVGFVAAMNNKAHQLGLQQTMFENASGLDDAQQLTTASDLSILLRAVWSDPFLKETMATKKTGITDAFGKYTHWLYNTNKLLHTDTSILGGKTGTTDLAGEVLAVVSLINNHEVAIVVMGSQDRYQDVTTIKKWLNQHYQWIRLQSE